MDNTITPPCVPENFHAVKARLLVDRQNAQAERIRMAEESEQYALLLLTAKKLHEAGVTSTEMRVELGHGVFVTAEVEDCSKVIMKLDDETYAEMKMDRAIIVAERRLQEIKVQLEKIMELEANIEATYTILNSYVDEYNSVGTSKK